MDPTSLSQQLAKLLDTGAATIILLALVLCVLCWPRIVSGIVKLRGKKTVSIEGDVHTEERQRPVTCEQCRQHREAIQKQIDAVDKRIDEIGPALGRVFIKLDKNDKRSEDRACALYRRIDPLIQELGSVRGKVEMFEKLAEQATIGGKK